MNRRNFLKASAAAAAATTVLGPKAFATVLGPEPLVAAASDYTRSMHFVYGIGQRAVLAPTTDQQIKNALSSVTGGVTCLSPFLLNCPNPLNAALAPMVNWVQNQGIAIIPAVGYVADGNRINDFPNGPHASIVKAYAKANLGPHIRLENLSGYYAQPNGEADVKGFIQNCIDYGFTKIMLNPWPVKDNQYMPISAAMLKYIDATFQSVHPGGDWVLNPKQVDTLNKLHPSMHILVNYESPGPQDLIAKMSQADQINKVFKVTVDSIESFPPSAHLHWAPPFTVSYNPLEAGTRTWDSYIAPTLSSFQ